MTISVVQTATNASGATTSSFPAGVTAGNWLLLLGANFQFTTPPTAAPNNPQLGSNIVAATTLASVLGANNGDTAVIAWLYHIQPGDAAAQTVTYGANGQSGLLAPVGIELSAGGTLSADLAATGHGNTGGGTAFSLSAGSTAAANEFAATMNAFFSNNGSQSSGGFTIVDSVHSILAGYQAVPALGTAVSLSGNTASAFANFTSLIVTLQESGGGGPTFSGTGTAALSLAGSAAGAPAKAGSGAAAITLAAHATGASQRSGTGTAALTLAATSRAQTSALERQLVRLAVAAYFGGSLVTADAGVCFQGGPLASFGLGTAYPYSVRGVPDEYYTAGGAPGRNWGVVMSTTKVRRTSVRDSYGGGTSGWRARKYAIECQLELIAELPHIEEAGAGLDDLIDQVHALIAADRNLGTKAAYEAGASPLLIIQGGEGREGITDETFPFEEIDDKKGRYRGTATVAFEVLTMVAS